MAENRPPSPQAQIRFLQQLQRLLDEGLFTATYKYALLHAIADLCVLRGDDSGAPLKLSTEDIAERFIELYWRQAVPFPAPRRPEILSQNTGGRAAVVRMVREAREEYGLSLARLKRDERSWVGLRRDVARTVRTMPLWRLQTIGSETVPFLYPNEEAGSTITLRPGVAFCFRAFYPLIVDLVEGAWSQYIRRHNRELLGTSMELRSFLFGSERSGLGGLGPILEELQGDACFYCRRPLRGRYEADHFIPWRRYPVDLGHNFVLAHRRCNSQKADRLAAEEHLARWTERNEVHAAELGARSFDAGIPADLEASTRVTRWAYEEVERIGGTVWVGGSEVRALGEGWREVMG